MINKNNIVGALSKFQDRTKTFAEFIVEVYKDKLVEIYLGDSYENISTDQVSVSYPAVFCGKVIGAFKECLILDCSYHNLEKKSISFGHFLFINERSIRALSEANENSNMQGMFLRSSDIKSIIKAQ